MLRKDIKNSSLNFWSKLPSRGQVPRYNNENVIEDPSCLDSDSLWRGRMFDDSEEMRCDDVPANIWIPVDKPIDVQFRYSTELVDAEIARTLFEVVQP